MQSQERNLSISNSVISLEGIVRIYDLTPIWSLRKVSVEKRRNGIYCNGDFRVQSVPQQLPTGDTTVKGNDSEVQRKGILSVWMPRGGQSCPVNPKPIFGVLT